MLTCQLTKLETAFEQVRKAYPKLNPTDAALIASALTLTGRHAIALYEGTQYFWPEDYESLTGAMVKQLEMVNSGIEPPKKSKTATEEEPVLVTVGLTPNLSAGERQLGDRKDLKAVLGDALKEGVEFVYAATDIGWQWALDRVNWSTISGGDLSRRIKIKATFTEGAVGVEMGMGGPKRRVKKSTAAAADEGEEEGEVGATKPAAPAMKTAEEKAEERRLLAEQKAAEKKALAEQRDAEKKALAQQKEAERKAVAERKEAERKALADKKDAEKRAAAEKKAAELRAISEKKEAERRKAAEKKEKEHQKKLMAAQKEAERKAAAQAKAKAKAAKEAEAKAKALAKSKAKAKPKPKPAAKPVKKAARKPVKATLKKSAHKTGATKAKSHGASKAKSRTAVRSKHAKPMPKNKTKGGKKKGR